MQCGQETKDRSKENKNNNNERHPAQRTDTKFSKRRIFKLDKICLVNLCRTHVLFVRWFLPFAFLSDGIRIVKLFSIMAIMADLVSKTLFFHAFLFLIFYFFRFFLSLFSLYLSLFRRRSLSLSGVSFGFVIFFVSVLSLLWWLLIKKIACGHKRARVHCVWN